MNSNTLTTVIGYMGTMISKYTPLDLSNKTIEGIFSYHRISESITTSGQPSEEQFSLIKQAGYQTVINLAPQNAENSLKDEKALLKSLGINYRHIPVDFFNPKEEDFSQFVAAMHDSSAQKVWVHCAANMRVSAFIYRYRREILKENSDVAKRDLEKIWKPLGVWKAFVLGK